MVREDCSQTHRPGMQDRFVAEAAETCMTVHYLDALSNDDVPEDWKEREYGWHSRLSVNHEKRDVVYL